MSRPGHALVYALNTATIGVTALTDNQLISEVSAYVIGTPSTIGKFVLPLTNPALAAVRMDFASCAADAREGQSKMGDPHTRGEAKQRLFRINPAIRRGGFASYANFAYMDANSARNASYPRAGCEDRARGSSTLRWNSWPIRGEQCRRTG